MYAVDLQKGYDMPIVAQAVSNYFLEHKPVMETLVMLLIFLTFVKLKTLDDNFM